MRPTTPWSRRSRYHFATCNIGGEPVRPHHPHDHPGRDPFEGPRGGGHRRGGPPGPGVGGPGEEGGHGRRGRHGRAGRGDVRSAILRLLAEEPMHGYQLMQAVADRTGGGWRPSPGAVYPTIAQLEDEGLVAVSMEGGRKLVALTGAGREHVSGLTGVDPFAGFPGGGERVDLRSAVGEFMGAVHQLSRVGSAAQLAAAATVLADARRSLYLILAGEAGAAETAPSSAEDATG